MGHKGNRCQTEYGAGTWRKHGVGGGLRSLTAFLVSVCLVVFCVQGVELKDG